MYPEVQGSFSMAVFDTHKAFTAFKEAGFNDLQARALIDQARDGSDALATKADLDSLAQATKADLDSLAQATKADLDSLAQATKADLDSLAQATKADLDSLAQATKADLKELEQRMTIRLGAMLFAAAGLQVVIIGILLALYTS